MDSGTVAGGSSPVLAILLVCGLGLAVFMIVSMWIVLKKAGRPGWAVLVPIYDVYVVLKVAGMPGSWVLWLLAMLVPIADVIVAVLISLGIAYNFGKSALFAVGLLFLPFVFIPILAFGDAKYRSA